MLALPSDLPAARRVSAEDSALFASPQVMGVQPPLPQILVDQILVDWQL